MKCVHLGTHGSQLLRPCGCGITIRGSKVKTNYYSKLVVIKSSSPEQVHKQQYQHHL